MTEIGTKNIPQNMWHLLYIARQATRAERHAFWTRGFCAAQIMEQVKRLRGGRGRCDRKGRGRVATLEKLAHRIGVKLGTFYKEAKIYRVFVAPLSDEETLSLQNNSLPRGFYVAALDAPDPLDAINFAIEKRRTNPNYKIKEFKEYVQSLWPSISSENKRKYRPIKVELTPSALAALGSLTSDGFYAGKNYPAVVEAALLHLREQQVEQRSRGRSSTSAVVKSPSETVVNTVRKDLSENSNGKLIR